MIGRIGDSFGCFDWVILAAMVGWACYIVYCLLAGRDPL